MPALALGVQIPEDKVLQKSLELSLPFHRFLLELIRSPFLTDFPRFCLFAHHFLDSAASGAIWG